MDSKQAKLIALEQELFSKNLIAREVIAAKNVAHQELYTKFQINLKIVPWRLTIPFIVMGVGFGMMADTLYPLNSNVSYTETVHDEIDLKKEIDEQSQGIRLNRRQITALRMIEKGNYFGFLEEIGDDPIITFDHVYEVGKAVQNGNLNKKHAASFLKFIFEDNAKRFIDTEIAEARKTVITIKKYEQMQKNESKHQKIYFILTGALAGITAIIALSVYTDEQVRKQKVKEAWTSFIDNAWKNDRLKVYETFHELGIPVKGAKKHDQELKGLIPQTKQKSWF